MLHLEINYQKLMKAFIRNMRPGMIKLGFLKLGKRGK